MAFANCELLSLMTVTYFLIYLEISQDWANQFGYVYDLHWFGVHSTIFRNTWFISKWPPPTALLNLFIWGCWERSLWFRHSNVRSCGYPDAPPKRGACSASRCCGRSLPWTLKSLRPFVQKTGPVAMEVALVFLLVCNVRCFNLWHWKIHLFA